MVFIAPKTYTDSPKYADSFATFSYPLSPFQKHAIQGLVDGNHVLITAHTGSGKTLPAEFAIQHFVRANKKNLPEEFIRSIEPQVPSLSKKVIYCSPIKALSNQKFYEFQKKYPDISFGLLTGDNKINPSADVLIMTTEILMNSLFLLSNPIASTDITAVTKDLLEFHIDLSTELACVVFDEIHYINDVHRGHVWEKSIMMLPRHVQLLMLSATIDQPVTFAEWVENRPPLNDISTPSKKQVILASTTERVVPLSHYSFLTATESVYKKIKDKKIQQEIRMVTDELMVLQNEKGQFQEPTYQRVVKTLQHIKTTQVDIRRKHTLNRLLGHLVEKQLLPAILFLFSRKQVELCAKEITAILLEDDSKIPYIVRKECGDLLRSKLPNFQEYTTLPEYDFLVGLLEKGIGIHHSGMIPIFREMVELFISKKYIKLLIATESFAIGLDCPIKSVLFTHFMKFDGSTERFLQSHEYTQMAGRAGRRGIDTVGYVIHCNNLFPTPSVIDYKKLLCGKPERFVSKLELDGFICLQQMAKKADEPTKETELVDFLRGSMMNVDYVAQRATQEELLGKLQKQIAEFETNVLPLLETSMEVCEQLLEMESQMDMASHKRKKELQRDMDDLKETYPSLPKDLPKVREVRELRSQWKSETEYLETLTHTLSSNVGKMFRLLERLRYVCPVGFNSWGNDGWTLTKRGILVNGFREINGLLASRMILETQWFQGWTPEQIVSLLSCFCDIRIGIDASPSKWNEKEIVDPKITDLLEKGIQPHLLEIEEAENEIGIYVCREQPVVQTVLVNIMEEWCRASTEEECKAFVQQRLLRERDISLGDFVKIILKIVAMKKELENASQNKPELLYVLSKIEGLVSKFIMTSQSLYL